MMNDTKRTPPFRTALSEEAELLTLGAEFLVLRFDTDGRITGINDYSLSYLGYTRDFVEGLPLWTLIAPSSSSKPDPGRLDGPGFVEHFLADRKGREQGDYGTRRADGFLLWIAWTILPTGDTDRPDKEYLAIGVDITVLRESRLAEARLHGYFESLLLEMPAAAVMVDHEGCIGSWSPEAERLFGYTATEALGVEIDKLLVPEELREEAQAFTLATRVEQRFIRSITKRRRKDGSLAEVELRAVPLVIDGQSSGGIAIYHDISELAQARRDAEAANEAKSVFLATMSHEIRTPLNAVIGMTTLLLGTPLSPEQTKFVETIRSSGETLLSTINEILDFSKIEAGRMEVEEQPFDLRACMESALDLVSAQARAKGIRVRYMVQPDCPAMVVGDSTRYRQIVLNLLANAVKFTEKGEISLEISAHGAPVHPSTCGGERFMLAIVVRDSGIGIPADRMNRLFTAFSQVDASTARRFGGTGLGLAISQKLASLMGGTIEAQSEGRPGSGSVFTFRVPSRTAPDPRAGICEDSEVPTAQNEALAAAPGLAEPLRLQNRATLARLRILLAEDNLVNRQVALLFLSRLGCRADSAANGIEVLQALGRQAYDVILMDVQMPEMDGLEATRHLRAGSWIGGQPAVVAMTANAMAGDRERCLEAGMDDYIVKPLRLEELEAALLRSSLLRGLDSQPQIEPETQAIPGTAVSVLENASATSPQTAAGPHTRNHGTRAQEDPQILDPEAIAQLAAMVGEGGQMALSSLIGDFLAEAETQIADMASTDAGKARRAAHSLKSGALIFGATTLSELCADYEGHFRTGAVGGCAPGGTSAGKEAPHNQVEAIRTEYACTREALLRIMEP